MDRTLELMGQDVKELMSVEDGDPMNKFCLTYAKMVLLLLNYIRSVRTGHWLLHIKTLQDFAPFFFALNRSTYGRFVPVYVGTMHRLEKQNPCVWEYLTKHWVVRKSQIAFTAIGCDHALEHVNRVLKGEGGLVGITRNASARTRHFLIQDEIFRIKDATTLSSPRTGSEKHRRLQ